MSEQQQEQLVGQDEESQARRKKLIIIGAAIAAVVVLLTIILILGFTLGGGSCRPIDIPPKIDRSNIRAIPSRDDRALVRFAGYLVEKQTRPDSFEESRKYLELKPKWVERLYQHDDTILIRVHTDCALFDIQIRIVGTEDIRYHVIDYTFRSISSGPHFGICTLDSGFEFRASESYSCHVDRTVVCDNLRGSSNSSLGISSRLHWAPKSYTIHMVSLDYELDGNPQWIEEGKFDKPPAYC